ncbi:hypothetical protein OG607_33565 [Streptomyces sp. NBC_01537]
MLLTVDFRIEDCSPVPKVGTGLGYEVSVGADSGGGTISCWQ